MQTSEQTGAHSIQIARLTAELAAAKAVIVGAGAGLSTSAGFTYSGERFRKYFGDFAQAFGIRDMYSGGFYPFPDAETQWGWWSRHIWFNRYVDAPKPAYKTLYELLDGRPEGERGAEPKTNYFVITTNVDHLFRKAGFEKNRLFYTQGDYGLWQCSMPCHKRTYDNEEQVKEMLLAQGFLENEKGIEPPQAEDGGTDFEQLSMMIPPFLVPACPVCGRPMAMNLRADNTFVEDKGWEMAAGRYRSFLDRHAREGARVLFLELGVGANTPGIIKYPFWQMVHANPTATYACINVGEAYAPEEIARQSVCIDEDIGAFLDKMV